MNKLKLTVKRLLDKYPQWLARVEFNAQKFTRFNERPVEYGFVFRQIAQLYPHTVLDVGTGTSALPNLIRKCGCTVTAIDNVHDYWPVGMTNRHFYVIDDDITKTRLNSGFDLITCISVLEHVRESNIAVRNMLRLLNPGGHLILTFPYTEHRYVENVYQLSGSTYGQQASYICQSYSRNDLNQWFGNGVATVVEQEFWQYWDGDFWTTGTQIIPPHRVDASKKHQLTCLLIQKG